MKQGFLGVCMAITKGFNHISLSHIGMDCNGDNGD